jgi:dipeptidyl aminopeptidase/acylaminoacyl peptidase
MKIRQLLLSSCAIPLLLSFAAAQAKSKLTLDTFFNSVSYPSVAISPDGNSVVIVTERADWDQQIFRDDLWLYRDKKGEVGKAGSLIQLTQSGHDTEPKWSPDGRWIAFLSERKSSSGKDSDSDSDDDKGDVSQLYVISPDGGEAIQLTQGQTDVHTFSWSADSRNLYFATRRPWNKEQKDAYKDEWKDVVQYRTAERGDTIFVIELGITIAQNFAEAKKQSTREQSEKEKESDETSAAHAIATSPLRVEDLVTSPDGRKLAFVSNAINQRQEKYEDVEIYDVDLPRPPSLAHGENADVEKPVEPRRLTHNQAIEGHLHWAKDNRHIFFAVEVGDISGPYRDLQPHLYWIDTEKPDSDSGAVEQWSKNFIGPVEHYAVASDSVLALARIGTEVAAYSTAKANQDLDKLNSWPGTYENISAADHSPKIAFIYSSLQKPTEIYLADSAEKLDQARPITSFNQPLADSDLPQGKPYRWKADDGTTVEGMLIYPPGKFEPGNFHPAKPLPMFTFIHGGPADADGNHFEADWYQWAALAATNGWLVFEPNYRGSTGYGDKFLEQIVPQIVSRPGKDILEGVGALVKDGIADPGRLTIGGYSYGGYMTNWLITQSTQWKAAVTGAGAVEHVGNWGNDDTTYDDAYFLGGRPWEAQQRYHDEAAIFQIDKVRTPTHMVAGADDIRVAVLEDYLLEHALYSLGIPNALLIFPGEGHSLDKNPWHGKIKVREELKWLQKYGGVPAN